MVSEAEGSKTIKEAIFYTANNNLSSKSQHISPLTLKDNIKQWKKENKYQEKVHLQDLLYFNILDFVTDDQTNGTHQVLKLHYENEKSRYLIKHRLSQHIKYLTKALLNFEKSSYNQNDEMKLILKQSKILIRQNHDDGDRSTKKIIIKICKTYLSLEDEKYYLYEKNMNESTYTMIFLRPIIILIFKPLSNIFKFLWGEVSLQCKNESDNKILTTTGRSASSSKVDGVIIDDVYNMEVGIIEVSGPNYKVNKVHYLEDKNKIAKNLRTIYKSIEVLKSTTSMVMMKDLKVYDIQVYLNELHVYSCRRAYSGHFVFNRELSIDIPYKKSYIHGLPKFLSQLWIIKELFYNLHLSLTHIMNDQTSSESNCSSDSNESIVYTPFSKKQKI